MSTRACSEDGCGRKYAARGLCKYHYLQAWTAKTLDGRPRDYIEPTATLDQRLRKIGWTVTEARCWEWNGSRTSANYGQLAVNRGRPIAASRAAHEAWIGPIPDGMFVCHRCDNPPCMNPEHLFLGTPRDNVRDMQQKLRTANGERHGSCKLSDEEVAEIRQLRASGLKLRDIADAYGVTISAICGLTKGKARPLVTQWIEEQS